MRYDEKRKQIAQPEELTFSTIFLLTLKIFEKPLDTQPSLAYSYIVRLTFLGESVRLL